MSERQLPAETKMGPVHLTVSDLERSIAFYRRALGLLVLGRRDETAVLGAGQRALIHLYARRDAGRVPWRTGLYHFALLVPSRADLGYALRNLIATNTRLTGGADHLVSEALYLDDPDGNGIELYRDRPRDAWPRQNGRPQMDSLALDYQGLLASAAGTMPANFRLHPDTTMGHVHLHVAQLQEAVDFYCGVLGFDLQLQMGRSAAFLAAGGYHHHIGVNTWAGLGAPPPPEGAAGLRFFEIKLPNKAALNELIGRLQRARLSYESGDAGLYIRDPSRNRACFTAG